MVCKSKKEESLSNPANKQRFIKLLRMQLICHGCIVHHAKSDVDMLIVQKTVEAATTMPTILVGEDTDLLVLTYVIMLARMIMT